MSRSLVQAMESTALLDATLSDRIQGLHESVPALVGRGDARRIAREADDLRAAAVPVRQKALAERREVHRMVQDMVAEIGPTMTHCTAMDWGISELGDTLASSYEPEVMRTMRGEIIGLVRDLAGSAGALRAQLVRTHQRVQNLEGRIASQQRALASAKENADRDALTSLYNRGAFDRGLLTASREAKQAERSLALVLLDMDHFKNVNDVHGHASGDQVLRVLASCLRAHVRQGDLVARVGGEEFAILVYGADDDVVVGIVERVRAAVEGQIFESDAGAFSVTISAGVAHMQRYEGPLAFYKRADKALYEAKHHGRNRYVVAA